MAPSPRFVAQLLLGIGVWAMVLAPVAYAVVTFEASVPTTVNGQQTQGIVVGCQTVDGQSVVDTETIEVELTNGATVPVKVDCRAPVYMYDLLPAGSVPQRVVPITIPLCDSPINPFTGRRDEDPERRRLMRMSAALAHVGHGRKLRDSAFRHWGVEQWHAYVNDEAHLVRELGLSPEHAAQLEHNITTMNYMYDIYLAAPASVKMGLDGLLGTPRAMFPPFMRDLHGNIMKKWERKVRHGLEEEGDYHEDEATGAKVRRLVFDLLTTGLTVYNTYTIETDVKPRLTNLEDTLGLMATDLEDSARAMEAQKDFSDTIFYMAGNTSEALEATNAVVGALNASVSLNAENIAKNYAITQDIIADNDADFATAYAEREALRMQVLELASAADGLRRDMGQDLNEMRDFLLQQVDVTMEELRAVDKRAADAAKTLMEEVTKTAEGTQTLALYLYKQQTQQQVRRDLTGVFYAVRDSLMSAGWKPFLWQNTGDPADAARVGSPPAPEDWRDGSVHRRVSMDTFQVLFASRGQEGAGGVGTTNHVLHEHTYEIVCDARLLMNNVAPWFKAEDMRRLVGPKQCLPLPPGTVGGVPTTSPDPERGEWTTTTEGDPKANAMGKDVSACTCWIEFRARKCTHGETTTGTNPFDRVGFNPTTEIGQQGLDSPALCTGTGASAPAVDTAGYSLLQTNGMSLYTIDSVLTSPTDPGRQWYHADQQYIQDWSTFMSLLEWGCGHERFVPFTGNPTALDYRRVKFFGDNSAYALVTSDRMSNLYQDTAQGGARIAYVQKITSYADTTLCDAQNQAGLPCFAQPNRAHCLGCQECSTNAILRKRTVREDAPTPPTSLGQAVMSLMDQGWTALTYALSDMETSLFGVMPADVSLTTSEFTYSPSTRTSYKCRMLTSIYTLGEAEPLAKQQLRSVHKYMSVRMDPWGNTGTEGDPDSWVKTPGGAIALDRVWEQSTSDPSMFNDATVFLESNMVWAGSKQCLVEECTSPDVFLATAGSRLPTEQTRYTYNVPQGLLSASPDPAGRIGSPTYIMSALSPGELGVDGLTLNRWASEFPEDSFDPAFASASLHHYYMPLVKEGNNIRCSNAMTAEMGPICALLDNYVVYVPTSDEYGDPSVAEECNKPDVLCYRPKRFAYRQQFVIPQGTTTQSFVTACPTLDTAPILRGSPTVYLSHSTTSVIQARLTMSGPECQTKVQPVTVPPSRRVPVAVEVCGDMDITVERFNAAAGEWVDCGNEETVDVQPAAEFGGDAANVTIVQPTTYIYETDNTRLTEVGSAQNAQISDMQTAMQLVLGVMYQHNATMLDTLRGSLPGVFNISTSGHVTDVLLAEQAEAAAAEKARVAKNQELLASAANASTVFDEERVEQQKKLDDAARHLDDVVRVISEDVMPRLAADKERLDNTTEIAIKSKLDAAAGLRQAERNADRIKENSDALEDALQALGSVASDAANAAKDVVSGGLDAFGDLLGAFGGGIFGSLFTLMLPCLVAILAGGGLLYCCRGNIAKSVRTAATNPTVLSSALGPAGVVAMKAAQTVLQTQPMSVYAGDPHAFSDDEGGTEHQQLL